MFSNTYLPFVGGVEQSIATFAQEFRDRGHRCLVVTPEMEGAEDSTREVLRIPAVKQVAGTPFSVHIPVPGLIGAKLSEFEPDIIHSHHPFLLGDAALRQARKRGVPLVFTYHTVWERYADFFMNKTLKEMFVKLTVEYSNLCSHVIAPSKSMQDFLVSLGVTRPITVIPTGIDTAFLGSGDRQRGRAALGVSDKDKVAGFVGRVGPEKNLLFLTEAALQWCRRDADARFMVVGNGVLIPEIKRLFAEAGMESHLIAPGILKGQALADAYAAMDVFAFTSMTETQGIVLAEAMAAGKPILAIDAPGAREAVTDGVDGRLLPADVSAQDFAQVIEESMENPYVLETWGRNAVSRSLQYSRQDTADRMLRLYQQLIESEAAEHADDLLRQFRALNALCGRLEAEWELFSTKAAAVAGVAGASSKSE